MKHFEYENAHSIEDVSLAVKQGAKVLAGGTDLLGVLKTKILSEYPKKLVNIKTIEGMDEICETEDTIQIGANVKLSEIAEAEPVKQYGLALAEAAHSVASPLIRNQATIGGNVCQDTRCWYYRYPHQLSGRIVCARKGGESCSAFVGDNRYHSIFGGMRVHRTACAEQCPVHVDIPQYLQKVREGDLEGAARILMRKNPIPAITARVCTHFCMQGCNRDMYDEEVNIGQIERYVGDYILEHADELMKAPDHETGKKIAIIGAGPAALTAAYYLRKEGHDVTILDKMGEAGGLLMYAIPEYRLPKEKVRQATGAIAAMGVKFRQNIQVGVDIQVDELIDQYDSVFLDTGAWKRNVIGIDGEDLTDFGLEFLVGVKGWMQKKISPNVIVVGGGNVAVDVAVTARRLGANHVTMVSLEEEDALPATKEEMERALEEGIQHIGGWGPKQVLSVDGNVTGMTFQKCVAIRDESGKFAPQYDKDHIMTVQGDSILLAVGQQIDLAYLDQRLSLETQRGRIAVEDSQMTSRPGVFAGGDAVTGPSTVVSAISAGRKAAQSIAEYVGTPIPEEKMEEGFVECGNQCLAHSEPVKANLIPLEERTAEQEDNQGLNFDEVQKEANRCFNCACFAVTPSDTATALMALKAVIHTNQRDYPADEFFTRTAKISDTLSEGEVVLSVEFKKQQGVTAYHKFRERNSIDFAVVGVASNLTIEQNVVQSAGIVMGAVAPIPIRARDAEEYLVGKTVDEAVASEAAELALKHARPLEANAYKVEIAKALVKKAILETVEKR